MIVKEPLGRVEEAGGAPLDWGRHYLVCPPTHFTVAYSINPWMDTAVQVDRDRAHDQWGALVRTLQAAGARVEWIPPVDSLPDMVFTANAGLVDGNVFIPARMGNDERRGEAAHFRSWFTAHGYQVREQEPGAIQEGAGDALPFRRVLIAGHGQRSAFGSYEAISRDAGCPVLTARLVDPRYYHVDIAFCPLDSRVALYAPQAFDAAGRQAISQFVPVPVALTPEETAMFCANSVAVGRNLIMPACTPRLGRILERHGFEVVVTCMSEFIKAGGGCRCLTLALDTVLSRDGMR